MNLTGFSQETVDVVRQCRRQMKLTDEPSYYTNNNKRETLL